MRSMTELPPGILFATGKFRDGQGRNLMINRATSMSVGQELRAVGQRLEALAMGDFDLQRDGAGYLALGISPNRVNVFKTEHWVAGRMWNALESTWQNLTGRSALDQKSSEPVPGVLRILFTPEGLMRLEAAGIVKRDPRSTGIPDPTRLGQILRMVGEGIDSKSGRLLKVSKRRNWIYFECSTDSDAYFAEEWKISELMEHWLEGFRKRESRADIVERELIRRARRARTARPQ